MSFARSRLKSLLSDWSLAPSSVVRTLHKASLLLTDFTSVVAEQVCLISSYLNPGESALLFESLYQLLCVFDVHVLNKVKVYFLFITKDNVMHVHDRFVMFPFSAESLLI